MLNYQRIYPLKWWFSIVKLVYQRVIQSSGGYTGCTVNYGTIHWGLILCSTLPGDQVTFEINTQTTHFKSEGPEQVIS